MRVPPHSAQDPVATCALCALPESAGSVLVVEDPLPPLEPAPTPPGGDAEAPYAVAAARVAAEIVVHAREHDATLRTLGPERLEQAIHVWADRYAELGARPDVGYALVHATAGDEAAATLAHPHSRVDAHAKIPPVPRRELETAKAHLERTRRCILCDVVSTERADGRRVVAANDSFLAIVPFAARLPYEVHVVAQRHAASLLDLTDVERGALADLLHRVLVAYDGLLGRPLPYVLAVHQAPTDDGEWQSVSHLHVELSPPLAGGRAMNAGVPERSAERLRALAAA